MLQSIDAVSRSNYIERFARALLSALSEHFCVLDAAAGNILQINRRLDFERQHSVGRPEFQIETGQSYLEQLEAGEAKPSHVVIWSGKMIAPSFRAFRFR